jgi:transcription antitermination factor NusG
MSAVVQANLAVGQQWMSHDAFVEPRWYAAYTSANHEKRVAQQLAERGVEHFLPLYASVRRWKDRRVQLELPLFPGYIFVRLALREKLRVLQIPGLACLVGFGGLPAPLPDQEVLALRSGLSKHLHASPHPFLTIGRRVRITSGALAGLVGILLRRKSGLRLVLSVELIMRSISVDIDESDVMPVLRTEGSSVAGDALAQCTHASL